MFKLSKWYLDCVTSNGDVAIAYTGTAQWGLFRVDYSSLLESTAQQITTRYSLRQQGQPQLRDSSISWQADALKLDGLWCSKSDALRQTIYSSDEGSIDWHCLMPKANVRFGGRVGTGYAEHLTMTIPPWKLPIQNLRWGRFISPSNYLVWIDWQGEFSLRTLFRDGKQAPASQVGDDRIEFEDGSRLLLDQSLVIREGRLGTTALSVIPGLKKTFPARLLNVDECKWRSRARLEQPGNPAVEGWAIHERVAWPK